MGDSGHILGRILDDQGIRLRQQRRRSGRVGLRVPNHVHCGLKGSVVGDSIAALVGLAGHIDIDFGWLDRK